MHGMTPDGICAGSHHEMYTAKYIKMAKPTVCRDLKGLVQSIFPNYLEAFYDARPPEDPAYHEEFNYGRMHDEAVEFRYRDSPLYWRFNAERRFLQSSYLMDELLREHNERFFFLTAQNCRICHDTWVSCIMYRLGQNERWMYIGMPTVICDAMAKIRKAPNGFASGGSWADGVVDTTKKPSTGLDLDREKVDSYRTSYEAYIPGLPKANDAQQLLQMKRTTEGGIQVGYVLMVNNKIERLPDEAEMAADWVLPEGLPDNFNAMNMLLNSIPRDHDFDSILMTTIDKNKVTCAFCIHPVDVLLSS